MMVSSVYSPCGVSVPRNFFAIGNLPIHKVHNSLITSGVAHGLCSLIGRATLKHRSSRRL